jgi:hypothetical protein
MVLTCALEVAGERRLWTRLQATIMQLEGVQSGSDTLLNHALRDLYSV